ncbi:YbaB/EbfC family nucleoid-associated protein [Saccharopolyspora tripterygii]
MPEEPGADIGAAERMIQQWQQNAVEKAEKFGRMQQEIEQLSITESSRDGAVQVTLGSNGIVRDIQLSPGAANRPMPKLAAELMRTIALAQSKIPELMRQAVVDTVGLQDASAQHVLTEARKNFPEPPEDDPADDPRGRRVPEMQFQVEDDYEEPQRRQPPPAPPQRRTAPPPPQQQRPTRRRQDDFDDDDDFGGGSFLR